MARVVAFAFAATAAAAAAAPSAHHRDTHAFFEALLAERHADPSPVVGREPNVRLPPLAFAPARPVPHGAPAPALKAAPVVLSGARDDVTLSWAAIPAPADSDWVGIYLAADDAHEDYLDFFYVEGADEHTLSLLNMRTPYVFRYFQYAAGGDAYQLVCESNPVVFRSTPPMQAHLALTENADEMRLMFVTDSWAPPVVMYGTVPGGPYPRKATGTSATYAASDMCNSPATIDRTPFFMDPGVLHEVVMTGLDAGVRYYYVHGHDGDEMAEERSFRAAPEVGAPTTFFSFGDQGTGGSPGAQTSSDILAENAEESDFMVLIGDLSYALGRGAQWERWMEMIEPFASRMPTMVSLGNHEYCHTSGGNNDPSGEPGDAGFQPDFGNQYNDSGGECGWPVYARFRAPDGPGNGIFWYSFDYGNVHIAQVATDNNFLPGSPQYAWLEADLAAVNRTRTPFVIVTMHRPAYNPEIYPSDFRYAEGIAANLEPLLLDAGVDMVLAGHYHSFVATYPVGAGGTVDPERGIRHITVGSAGAGLDSVPLYDVEWCCEYWEYEFGVGRIDTTADALTYTQIRNRDRAEVYTVTLPRRR